MNRKKQIKSPNHLKKRISEN